MVRLTNCNKEMPSLTKDNEEYWLKLYFKLKEYEDLEEHGRLIVLPCKIGDTIYITGSRYRRGRIESWINTGKFRISDMEELGKHIFLTKEEAEKALAEMRE